ncbi:MAG: TIR domain-containing protein [Actinocatenispora sp.]
MAWRQDVWRADRPLDFFISYSPADERWAAWIAWELESAGYRTMLQAWDFVAGTRFIDFMDRGIRDAALVVAVLSPHYLRSTYGALEWQAALRADPTNPTTRLLTVRVEDCRVEGLLATITFLDLVGVVDVVEARAKLLGRIREAAGGRAKPAIQPGYPQSHDPSSAVGLVGRGSAGPSRRPRSRRTPFHPPVYPRSVSAQPSAPRDELGVLHIGGTRFGRGLVDPDSPVRAEEMQAQIWGELSRLADDGTPAPELIVVTGDLTESGTPREFEEALAFLTGMRVLLGLEPHRVVIVPGPRDVTLAACRAYFANCEADDLEAQPPYWPKWRHFSRMFEDFYQGIEGIGFDSDQPWTLFAVPDLRVVVAGLNSTMAYSHRDDDRYGEVGRGQAAWFASRMRLFEESGWLRLGALAHTPVAAGTPVAVPPGTHPPGLRDAAMFGRVLGPRISLVLTNEGDHGPVLDEVDELPVVGRPGYSAFQLLSIRRDGVRVWTDLPGDEFDKAQRTVVWRSSAATFAPPSAAVEGPGAASVESGRRPYEPELDATVSPLDLLLDRVVEVCEARHERTTVRRTVSEPPCLVVTYEEDGFVRQQRVTAMVGTPTREDVLGFVQHVHASDPDGDGVLVYQGPPTERGLREEAQRRGIRLCSLLEFQGLLDLRSYVAAQTQRLANDPAYRPDMYVPQRFHHLVGPDQEVHDDLVDELLQTVSAEDGRFLLVLAEFGRGKTFALRELARRIPSTLPHLIPVFIELRTLDKAQTVEGLVAAHLAGRGEETIDLRAFRYMLQHGQLVLIFDGFDELVARVSYERAADHLSTLLQAAQGNAKVVVASRTQHFRTHSQVLTALGERVGLLPQRRLISIEDFDASQISAFLLKRYRGDARAARSRVDQMRRVQDLHGLASNPRMLTFIADLDQDRLDAVASTGRTIGAAALYREILRAWLSYEERRTQGVPGSPPSLTADELWRAVTVLALRLWESNDTFLRQSELADVAGTLVELAEAPLSADQAIHAVGAGSLLVRDDDGQFGFIHLSVAEWLVANEIARRLNDGATDGAAQLLSRRPLSQLVVDFLGDLVDAGAANEWARGALGDSTVGRVARSNAMRLTARLKIPAGADLRGAVLKGEDLSYRDLSEVDLRDADLTDARLVGTNLRGARLTGATLTNARLDEACLAGADLTGADLSFVTLCHTDLSGAVIDGGTWRRAALIDVSAGDGLAHAPELSAAAMLPRDPVLSGLAPPEVGVTFGFETGRLPQPVAYSPRGDLIAVGSDDGGVLLADTMTGQPIRTLQGHRGRVYAVLYGPGDAPLATAASDREIRLWDPVSGASRQVLSGHQGWVWPLCFHPDGTQLAAGDGDGTIRLWDVTSGMLRHRLDGHDGYIWSAVFQPGGELLAVGDASGTVRVWNTRTAALAYALPHGPVPVYRVVFSPDGRLLCTADHAGQVRLFDAETGALHQTLTGHQGRVYSVDFHPEGRLAVSGDTEGSVRLWDTDTGELRQALERHSGAVYSCTFSPDGGMLVTGDSDGVVRICDATGQVRHRLTGHKASVWPAVFRPGGGQLATASNDHTVRLWDTDTGQCRHVLRGHRRRIDSVAFRGDGSQLAVTGNDGRVRLWDPRTGVLRRTLDSPTAPMIAAIFAPDDPLLAVTTAGGGMQLWNADSHTEERELDVETEHVWATAFSPDGDVLATANDDDTVRLWYRTTGRGLQNLAEHRGRVRSIAFSQDGSTVATGCDDRAVRLWNANSGECLARLDGHTDRVYSLAFSPDGRLLASASNDGTARLWDPRRRVAAAVLTGHAGKLWSAAFSPDGRLLATAGDDLVIRLWGTDDFQLRATLAGHTRRISSVAFSPDGTLLASGSHDGTLRLWRIGPDSATLRATLIGLPDGWVAVSPDGWYKMDGEVAGAFWQVVGTCRFEPGELDRYVATVRRAALDATLI